MASRRRKYIKPRYRRGRRGSATTETSKARSLQTCWRNGTGSTSTLTIANAKKLIDSPPSCPYCRKQIPWRELSLDHIHPKSRGGSNDKENLVWVDAACNRMKGDLTGDEFIALLNFLQEFPRMRESIVTRLRMASALFRRRR